MMTQNAKYVSRNIKIAYFVATMNQYIVQNNIVKYSENAILKKEKSIVY